MPDEKRVSTKHNYDFQRNPHSLSAGCRYHFMTFSSIEFISNLEKNAHKLFVGRSFECLSFYSLESNVRQMKRKRKRNSDRSMYLVEHEHG